VVVSLPDNGDIDYGGYELDLIRQRQKANREKLRNTQRSKRELTNYSKRTE